jgi:hypothetical protein
MRAARTLGQPSGLRSPTSPRGFVLSYGRATTMPLWRRSPRALSSLAPGPVTPSTPMRSTRLLANSSRPGTTGRPLPPFRRPLPTASPWVTWRRAPPPLRTSSGGSGSSGSTRKPLSLPVSPSPASWRWSTWTSRSRR